jgi:hypothetical protein
MKFITSVRSLKQRDPLMLPFAIVPEPGSSTLQSDPDSFVKLCMLALAKRRCKRRSPRLFSLLV